MILIYTRVKKEVLRREEASTNEFPPGEAYKNDIK